MISEDYISVEAIASTNRGHPFSKRNCIWITTTLCVALGLSFIANKQFGSTYNQNSDILGQNEPIAGFNFSQSEFNEPLTEAFGIAPRSQDTDNLNAQLNSGKGTSLDNYDDVLPENALADADYEMDQHVRNLAENVEKDTSSSREGNWLTEDVQKGDTISSLFEDLNIPASILMNILENKQAARQINHLKLGEPISFLLNDDSALLAFVKPIDKKNQLRIYRNDDKTVNFTYAIEPIGSHLNDNDAVPDKAIESFDKNDKVLASNNSTQDVKASENKNENKTDNTVVAKTSNAENAFKNRGRLVLVTVGKGEAFSTAANKEGITYAEINRILQMFKGRIQFSRNIRAGDTMRVLFTESAGKGKIAAVEFNLAKGGKIASYLNPSDNKYYDENGLSSNKSSFRRIPFNAKVRVTSNFNPGRRHPVLGTIRPHNGTDFGLPVGTPIVAPTDGVVDKAAYSRTAGYYVVLRHRGGYSTVYMHLSKILVKQGQRVKLGANIARSGNTGRSTGPHLHYELRINGRPVNAMRVNLGSRDVEINSRQRKRFEKSIAEYKRDLHRDSLIAKK